ncbi:MAG: M20/M25/M40 family metallo-hydrolase [Gemmataceae bacterium]
MTHVRTPYSYLVSRPMVRTCLLLGMASVILPAVLAEPPVKVAPAGAALDPVALDKKIIAEAKDHSEIMANLTYISDMIGPRLTGSAALKKANDWTADKMRAYGLSNVHLEGWTIPVGWERGPATVRIVEPNIGRALTVAAMAWTPGTKGKIECDVVAINARTVEDLAKVKDKYKGKLKNAVILSSPPATIAPVTQVSLGFEQRRRPAADEKGNKQRDEKGNKQGDGKAEVPPPPRMRDFTAMRAFRRELMEFLRSEGAAVLLMDSSKPHGLLNMTGNWRSEDRVNAGDPLPTLFVAHEHYAQLYRLAARPAPARTRVEVEIDCKFIPGPIPVYNTVGEIPGTEKPDEFVVLGAHLDSWDLGQGTTDNGTGSCVVLEAARVLVKSGIRPKRTIRFVLFTGEEQGLHGSKEYVKKHKEEMAKTSMALVHDMGTGRVVGMALQGRKALLPIMEKELISLKELGVKAIDDGSMGGTDHLSFEGANVPGFAVRQDPAEYRFTHHSQSDTLDKAKEPDLIQGSQVLSVSAVRVANLPQLLPRDKPPGTDRPRRQGGGERKQETPPAKAAPEKK